MGAAWLLPRIVGLGHASELLMLGDFITAARAYEIGLYNKVVAGDQLEAEALKGARKLADGPGYGLAVTKRMLNLEAEVGLAEAMQLEGWIQAECMKHPDYREAYEAFVGKRAPDFVKHAPKPAASARPAAERAR
jgi:enoyl-CoA hydratase/carnithine racemase